MKAIIDAIKAELELNVKQSNALNLALGILEGATSEAKKEETPALNIPVGWKVWGGDGDKDELPDNAYFWSKGLNKWEKSLLNGRSIKGMTLVYIVPDYHVSPNHNVSDIVLGEGFRFLLKGESYDNVTHYWYGYNQNWSKKALMSREELHEMDTYRTNKPLPNPNDC